jgi:cell wall assembly regulator SMI1
MSLDNNWKRIALWHKRNARRGKFQLARGASMRRLDALEKALGIYLPADVRESYLLHNGTAGTWLLYHGEVMPLGGVEAAWQRYGEWQQDNGYGFGEDWKTGAINGPIKPVWWNPLRIPVTDNGGGDPIMLDLDPGKGGTRGQVIKFNHEVGPVNVLASSWTEWLSVIADDLEAGKYVYLEEAETVAPPGFYD